MKDPIKVKIGKKSKAQGSAFELRTRKDLEEKGWIVDRWSNNVELPEVINARKNPKLLMECIDTIKSFGKLIPAKVTWRRTPKGMFPMGLNSGFPDFVVFRKRDIRENHKIFNSGFGLMLCQETIIGVEVKTNGYLDKTEKEKCQWYLDNNIFSKILIASKYKEKNRVKIKYTDFEEKYGK